MWLLVAISAYLIFAIVFLVDKYLLVKSIPDPKIYSFYVSILGMGAILLLPFINFYVLDPYYLFLSFIAGATFVLGILWFFKGLKLFEPSRIVPAIGGIVPILTFLLLYFFSGGKEIINFWETLSLALLILGSVLMTYERSKRISWESLKVSFIAALFFALSFVSAKYVYLENPFLLGLVWIKLGGVLMALIFLFDGRLRNELFGQRLSVQRKTTAVFLTSQTMGAGAGILQNWAVALAPLTYVAFISALQGVQYVFLLIIAIFLSLKFPWILKEEISRRIIFQKIIAILLIGGGLVLLVL